MKMICVVIYDSIFNSVFHSQVIAPLVNQLNQNNYDSALVVSFERGTFSHKTLSSLIIDPRIQIRIITTFPFLGSLSLEYAALQLRPLLARIKPDQIIARGPLAGYIVAQTHQTTIPLTIQARGLCAQEYLYVHQSPSWWHRFRAWQYERIEQYVYGRYAQRSDVTIETVSNALKEYLISNWKTPSQKISIAQNDIPAACNQENIQTWRASIRSQLNIPEHAYVYVYAGSAHPWQCPEKTVQFFAKELKKNRSAFLLILTQSAKPFQALLKSYAIPETAYYITSIPHAQMYHYLAAADAGLLFRETHCINWVSRPTKALEYQAVGLPIIHNDTVEMLCSYKAQKKRPSLG